MVGWGVPAAAGQSVGRGGVWSAGDPRRDDAPAAGRVRAGRRGRQGVLTKRQADGGGGNTRRRDAHDQATQSATVTAERPPPPPPSTRPMGRARFGPKGYVNKKKKDNTRRGGEERWYKGKKRGGGGGEGEGRGNVRGGRDEAQDQGPHRAHRDGFPSLPPPPPHAACAVAAPAVGTAAAADATGAAVHARKPWRWFQRGWGGGWPARLGASKNANWVGCTVSGRAGVPNKRATNERRRDSRGRLAKSRVGGPFMPNHSPDWVPGRGSPSFSCLFIETFEK